MEYLKYVLGCIFSITFSFIFLKILSSLEAKPWGSSPSMKGTLANQTPQWGPEDYIVRVITIQQKRETIKACKEILGWLWNEQILWVREKGCEYFLGTLKVPGDRQMWRLTSQILFKVNAGWTDPLHLPPEGIFIDLYKSIIYAEFYAQETQV